MGRPVGVWARVEMYFTGEEKTWSMVFWYTGAGAFPSNYNQATAGNAFYAQLVSSLLPLLNQVVMTRGVYVIINNGAGSYGVKVYNTDAGTGSNSALPEDVAAVVQRISDTPGPSGRGRIYVSGVDNGLAVSSYLTPAGITAFNAWGVDVKAAVVDQGITWSPAVYSEKLNMLHAMSAVNTIALLGTIRRRRTSF